MGASAELAARDCVASRPVGTVVLAVVAAGLAAVVTMTLLLAGTGLGVRAWSRWRGGLSADGVVVAARAGETGGPTVPGHSVTAEFRTPDGEPHRVVLQTPAPLAVGTPVSLRYPAGDPHQAVLAPPPR